MIDVERKVPIRSDVARNPDRLWVDLVGARLHPNLKERAFPVGDGLLEQVRIGKNREDVVRVVLDFKDVWEHQVFYLENPTRLVIDVRGQGQAPASARGPAAPPRPRGVRLAAGPPAPPSPPPARRAAARQGARPVAQAAPAADATASAAASPEPRVLPSRRVNGMVPPDGDVADAGSAPPAPIALTGVDQLPPARRAAPGEEAQGAGRPTLRSRPRRRCRRRRRSRRWRTAPAPTASPGSSASARGGSSSTPATAATIPARSAAAGLQEKDLVLDVALRLERLVRQELGTEVVMTRSTDVFIPLEERTAIANQRGADLFLSIHANSSRNSQARGIETYFLNFAKDAHAEAGGRARERDLRRPRSRTCRTWSRRSRSTARSTRAATSPPRSRRAW